MSKRYLLATHNLDHTGASFALRGSAEHLIAQSNEVDLMTSGAVDPDMRAYKDDGGSSSDYAAAYVGTILAVRASAILSEHLPVSGVFMRPKSDSI